MATTTELEHCALVAIVHQGPDEAAAAAVTAFQGDINAFPPEDETETVLCIALACRCRRPLTIAALAARGDCNPNVVTRLGTPMLSLVAGPYSHVTDMATFLAHFPTLDVDACDSTGWTPLHYAAVDGDAIHIQLLLDAGADPTVRSLQGFTPAEYAPQWGHNKGCTKLLEAAEAWHSGLRRGWLRAVVCISENIAV